TLEMILDQPALFRAFESYLTRHLAEENLVFLQRLWDLRERGEELRGEDVSGMLRDFLQESSPMEVNVTSRCRKEALERAGEIETWKTKDLEIFEEAEREIMNLVRGRVGEFNVELSRLLAEMCIRQGPKEGQRRVVIVGGGFTGLVVADALDRMKERFHVTMIDTKEYFEYTPSTVKLLTQEERGGIEGIRTPHERYVQNGRVLVGRVDKVYRDHVCLGQKRVGFDYLVLSTGSAYTSRLKSSRISTSYRVKRFQLEREELRRAQRVLVIGGGLVGVEVAAIVAEAYPEKDVVLVEANERLLKRTSVSVHTKVLARLEQLGVRVILGERIVDVGSRGEGEETTGMSTSLTGESGQVYACDKMYVATGQKPLSGLVTAEAVDERGHIRVQGTLQLVGQTHLFAGGDVTDVREEKTAYAAACAGVCIARNICRMEKGRSPLVQGQGLTRRQGAVPLAQTLYLGGQVGMLIVQMKRSFMGTKYWKLKEMIESSFLSKSRGDGGSKYAEALWGKGPKML
ncbi:MAG: hypothetical protein DHS80DRAFT_9698, partial [Piptocephalis tieghemiana]